MLLIGRLVICIGIEILYNYVFTGGVPQLNSELPQLSYKIVPIVVIGSYFITGAFFGVYAMAVDTMFLSFRKFFLFYTSPLKSVNSFCCIIATTKY